MTDLSAYSDAQLRAIAADFDPDTDALVRTVYGEAANQPPEGRKAVAAVIRNRSKLSGQPIGAVVREPGQFEPWADPKARARMEGLDPASDAYQAVLRDIEGEDDPTGGATHFYAPKAQAALGRKPPEWDDGSGFDIGDHRFFKGTYGGAALKGDPAQDDITSIPDDELEAIARGDDAPMPTAGADAPTDDFLGDVQFTSAPKSAANPKQAFVYADDQNPLTPGQAKFYEAEIKAGRLDPEKARAGELKAGSEAFPLAQRDAKDLPKPGDWYVTPEGVKKQVPADPWIDTGKHVLATVADAALPGYQGFEDVLAADPRFEAIKRGLQSGALLGGRNEIVAGIESLPKLLDGWGAVKDQFGKTLAREDQASGQARRDFPLAYDASATTGALASGAAIPEGLLPRLATGAGSGFLATDGDVGSRALGAGLGVVGGEVLGRLAPKVAGAVMDMTGLPMRAPQTGPVRYNPVSGFPLSAPDATRPELKVADALKRALERDETLPMTVTDAAKETGALPFHVGGDNLTALAEVLAQSPGKGQSVIRAAVRDQQAGVPARVKGEIAKTLGGDDTYFEKLDGIKESRRTAAREGMSKLQDHLVTLDDNSVLALRSDLARGAIREQAITSLASPNPEVRDAGARLNRLYDDLLDKPSAQTITVRDAQNISKSLLDAANDAYSSGNPTRGAALKDLGKAVRTNAAEPERGGFAEYGDWLKKYGEDSQGIDALEMGRQVFGNSLDMSAEKLRQTYAGWGETARENYRQGVGEAVLAAVRRKGGVTEARQLLKNEEFADRIRIAVPDHMSFKDFMGSLEREVQMADRNNRVVGGSQTYGRQAARADLEAQGRDPLDMAAEAIETGLSPAKLTAKGLKATLKALPRKDRSIIGDPAANAALGKALTNPDEMTRLLNMLETYRARRTLPMKALPARGGGYLGASTVNTQD